MFFLYRPSARSHSVITFRETVKLYTYEIPENGTPTHSVLESFGGLQGKRRKMARPAQQLLGYSSQGKEVL